MEQELTSTGCLNTRNYTHTCFGIVSVIPNTWEVKPEGSESSRLATLEDRSKENPFFKKKIQVLLENDFCYVSRSIPRQIVKIYTVRRFREMAQRLRACTALCREP